MGSHTADRNPCPKKLRPGLGMGPIQANHLDEGHGCLAKLYLSWRASLLPFFGKEGSSGSSGSETECVELVESAIETTTDRVH